MHLILETLGVRDKSANTADSSAAFRLPPCHPDAPRFDQRGEGTREQRRRTSYIHPSGATPVLSCAMPWASHARSWFAVLGARVAATTLGDVVVFVPLG